MRKMNNIRRGGALVLVIIAMVILFVTGVGLLAVGYGSRVLAIRDTAAIAARSAADAGISEAIHKLNKLLKTDPTFADPPSSLNVTTPQLIGPASNNQSVTYSITGNWSDYTIVSTGTSGGSSKTITAHTRAVGVFDPALFVYDELEMGNNNVISASGSGVELDVGTLSTDAGAIGMGTSDIYGNVFVGYGATDPLAVVDGGTVHGSIVASEEPRTMNPVGMPSTAGATPYTTQLTLGNGRYYTNSDVDLGGNLLTITGNVTLYLGGDLIMNQTGVGMRINAGGSLVLYINGDIYGKNNSEFNVNNVNSDPSTLKIYGTAVSPDFQTFNLKNNATIRAAIYAPNADVTIKNNADVAGSITARNIDIKNNMDFVYNASVRNYAKTDPGVYLVIANWSE